MELDNFHWAFWCEELDITVDEYNQTMEKYKTDFGSKPPPEVIESVKKARENERQKLQARSSNIQITESFDIGKLGQLPKNFQSIYPIPDF